MDQLRTTDTAFAGFVAECLSDRGFVLIDVGAAYGVSDAWRCFGKKLRGFGFDVDAEEVARLNSIEPASGFRYIAGHVGMPADHPFAARQHAAPHLRRSPWSRMAVQRWLDLQQAQKEGSPMPPKRPPASGDETYAAPDEPSHVIDLSAFLRAEGVTTVDFLKVDVDGADLDILRSMGGHYSDFGVLGVGVEVNFFGSDAETDNTFHNIDRFLKSEEFELIDLSIRHYPMQALPGPVVCGFDVHGRPLQGDAFYARDICAPSAASFTKRLDAEGLAKAAAIFSVCGLPDCAAEILVTFRDRLQPVLDVDRGLDLLARQAQPGREHPLSYAAYMSQFEQQSYSGPGCYSGSQS